MYWENFFYDTAHDSSCLYIVSGGPGKDVLANYREDEDINFSGGVGEDVIYFVGGGDDVIYNFDREQELARRQERQSWRDDSKLQRHFHFKPELRRDFQRRRK